MQYISFIGVGVNAGGYIHTKYNIDESIYETKLIQEAVIRHHISSINSINFFVTKESFKVNEEELKILEEMLNDEYSQKLKNPIKFNYTLIDFDADFEVFLKKLLEIIDDKELIIDITHSYRSIPMKLLFALNYLETTKNVEIVKLLYGKFSNNNSNIIDFTNDFKLQKLAYSLEQFDNSLIINATDTTNKNFIENKNLNSLFKDMKEFNKIIQLCNFDGSIQCCKNIVKSCKKVMENDEYLILVPILEKIIEKLDFATNDKLSNKKKRAQFINVLINHQLYQLAITFIDQLYRTELIRFIINPSDENYIFNENELRKILKLNNENYIIYNFSQAIKNKLDNINNSRNSSNNLRLYIDLLDNKYKNNFDNLLNKNIDIKNFYNNIRNRMNHGEMINVKNLSKELNDTINKIMQI